MNRVPIIYVIEISHDDAIFSYKHIELDDVPNKEWNVPHILHYGYMYSDYTTNINICYCLYVNMTHDGFLSVDKIIEQMRISIRNDKIDSLI